MSEMIKLSDAEEKRALNLHKHSTVIDCLQASVFIDDYFKTVKDAGVTAVNKTVAAPHNMAEAVIEIANWYDALKRHSDVAIIATTAKEILEAKKDGKVAYIMGFQDTVPLDAYKVNLLDVFYKLGVRIIQLTYNTKNLVGDGCAELTDCGLSHFGKAVIDRMNELGIIVDIGHVGDRTGMEAIEHAKHIICSHANARAVCDNVRNKTDETIKALAEKDGVIGINAFPAFVKWTKTEEGIRPTVNDLLDHLDHIVELVGANHVGIGLDLIDNWNKDWFRLLSSRPDVWGKPSPEGSYDYPVGIENVSQVINITRGLVARGYSDDEIGKILGDNWLRVFKRAFGE
jgi:membrane dipeptidase